MKTQVNYQIENGKVKSFIEQTRDLNLNEASFIYVDRDFWTNIYITASEKQHSKIEIIEYYLKNE